MKIKARRLSSRAKYKLLTIFALPILSQIIATQPAFAEVDVNLNIEPILQVVIPVENIAINLTPSPTAPVFGSKSLNITAATNNPAGYQLFLNATTTTLTNTKANEDGTRPTLETLDTLDGGYTESTFTLNRWGYRNHNTIKNNTPTNQAAGNYNAFVSGEEIISSDTATTLDQTTLDFATKIDLNQPSGTYTMDLEFSAVAKVLPGVVTINFHPGTNGTGTMTPQKIQTGNSSTIKQNTFTASSSDYIFAGWSTTEDGIVAYADQATYTTESSNQDSTLDLYAIWARPMQSFTKSMCETMANEKPIYLYDTRDNTIYTAANLKDGECWMLQNLKLGKGADSYTLTTANSDTSGNFTLSDKLTDGKFTNVQSNGIDYINDSGQFYCTDDYGCYYNWYTATAGSGTSATTSGNVNYSICPKGWTLPTGGSSGQFQALYNAYPSVSATLTNPTTNKENTVDNMPGLLLGGYYYSSGARNVGSYGYYWSRTANSAQRGYALGLNTSNVDPVGVSNKYYGLSVRCVAKPEPVTVNLVRSNAASIVIDGTTYTGSSVELVPGQHTISGNFTGAYGLSAWSTTAGTITSTTTLDTTINITQAGTLTLTGKTLSMQEYTKSICQKQANETPVALTDSRDNTTYSVAYLKDGECWMLQNLKLGKGADSYTLTTANSDTSGTFTLNGKITDSKFTNKTIGGTSNVNDSSQFYCTSDYGCYYNWYTATAGSGTSATTSGNVNYSICPKGWTLPTGGSSGRFQALYNAYGSASAMLTNNPTTDKENTANNMPGLLRGGLYVSSGAFRVGSYGYYWSRTAGSAQDGYYLSLNTSNVYPADGSSKYNGLSVRCLAK